MQGFVGVYAGVAACGEGKESGLERERGWAPVLSQRMAQPLHKELWNWDGPLEGSCPEVREWTLVPTAPQSRSFWGGAGP